jgi:hypothetical protein
MAQVVECLPSKCEGLGSTQDEREKERERERITRMRVCKTLNSHKGL